MPQLRGAANRLGILGLIGLCLAAPRKAEAAWDLFGGAHLAGGRSESTGALDPNEPALDSRARGEGTFILSVGARAAWSRSDLEAAYTPYCIALTERRLRRRSFSRCLRRAGAKPRLGCGRSPR